MKALTFNPENNQFVIRNLPLPTLDNFDVLINVEACGLNPVDAKIAQWQKMLPQMGDCWVPGLDVSGYIAAVGDAVQGWSVGDRVLCHGDMMRPFGGFAEYSIQDSRALIAHPAVSAEIAAATPCAGWTAWRALCHKMDATSVDTILVAGGSGGVGGFAIQIAKHLELKVIIATCSVANAEYVKSLGATHTIDYKTQDIVASVMQITDNKGVSLGLDTVGYDNDILVANSLGFEGQMLELVDTCRPSSYQDAFMKGLSFHQLSLGAGHRNGASALQTMLAAGSAFCKLLEQENVRVPVLKTVSLEATASALGEMLKQRTVGKLVMKI